MIHFASLNPTSTEGEYAFTECHNTGYVDLNDFLTEECRSADGIVAEEVAEPLTIHNRPGGATAYRGSAGSLFIVWSE